MKYKVEKFKVAFLPETKADAFRLGTIFTDATPNLVYKIKYTNSELVSVEIELSDILSMIGDNKRE